MNQYKENKTIRHSLIATAIMAVIMFLFSCTPCPAQVSNSNTAVAIQKAAEGVSAVYGDGKALTKEVLLRVDTIASKAEQLAKKVGPQISNAADYTWQALLRQQRVKSFVWLIIWLKGIILFIIAYKSLHKDFRIQQLTYEKSNQTTKLEMDYNFGMILKVITCLVAVIGIITASCYVNTIVTGFANPEFGAIKDLIEYSTPAVQAVQ